MDGQNSTVFDGHFWSVLMRRVSSLFFRDTLFIDVADIITERYLFCTNNDNLCESTFLISLSKPKRTIQNMSVDIS